MRVIVNAAMSADGKIALRGAQPLTLSDATDLQRVHQLRASVDAIVVGIGTVLMDDPQLTARPAGGAAAKQPVRVVLDSKGRTPPNARVLDATSKTIIFVAKGNAHRIPNAEVVEAGDERVDVRLALRELQARGVQAVLVEGGATVIGSFLRAKIVDELHTYIAPIIVGGGAPTLVEGPGATQKEHVLGLKIASVQQLGQGVLIKYVPR